jgi:hypothetical protein
MDNCSKKLLKSLKVNFVSQLLKTAETETVPLQTFQREVIELKQVGKLASS